MLVTASTEARTRAFYEWERRGRGWDLYEAPVALEPPLAFPDWHERPPEVTDDTRRAPWHERLLGGLRTKRSSEEGEKAESQDGGAEEFAPAFAWEEPTDELVVLLPPEAGLPPAHVTAWLSSLVALRAPVAVELHASGSARPEARLFASRSDTGLVMSSLQGIVAGVDFRAPARSLPEGWGDERGRAAAFEFGLAREFMIPLAPEAVRGLDFTPALASALQPSGSSSPAGGAGHALFQVLLAPTQAPWDVAVRRAVTTPGGQPFFADAPELTKLALEKVAAPLFAVTLRLLVSGPTDEAVFTTVRAVAGCLARLGHPGRNELVPLASGDGPELAALMTRRLSSRSGMILSAPELAALLPFPSASGGPIRRLGSERAAPEPVEQEGSAVLGTQELAGRHTPVRLGLTERLRHLHVVGASGTGKSTLLVNLIMQDLEAGRGLALLDPHGDLVDEVLGRIPEGREEEVVVLDPADPEVVVGWNVLSAAQTEPEREVLASDLVAVFRRLATSWGDQMTSVLANAVLSFLDADRGGTLVELRRFLTDPGFRADYAKSIRDPHLASYWTTEFPLLIGRRRQTPILTRLDALLRNRLVRETLTVNEGALDFRGLLDRGGVLLARLSQGAIGRENAALLGSLLVSKLHQAALTRQDTPLSARRPFFLYLDEFHELATPSMTTLFSGVRKFGLGLTVAHQDLYQLHAASPELERSVLANAHTRLAFRVGDEDARKLAGGFAGFDAERSSRALAVGGRGPNGLLAAVLPDADGAPRAGGSPRRPPSAERGS